MEKYLPLTLSSVPLFQYNVPKFIEDILWYLKKVPKILVQKSFTKLLNSIILLNS